MHPFLSVDELIRHLARELVESEVNATAVLKVCSRNTPEDPVLDVLWALLRCLPQDVWEVVDGSFTSEPVALKHCETDDPVFGDLQENPDQGQQNFKSTLGGCRPLSWIPPTTPSPRNFF
jgi:hypothetical protein